ncbi:MAG: sporulation protein YabP [Lachnospiraceae bacterium]|nr:sporulation protein YabP [Lachnospiraceae bacterium]
MEEKGPLPSAHKLFLQGRKQLELTGIHDVVSFDAKEVVLRTQMGVLLVRGEDLFVKRLTVEQGELDLEGRIDSLIYSEKAKTKDGESLMKRLFR